MHLELSHHEAGVIVGALRLASSAAPPGRFHLPKELIDRIHGAFFDDVLSAAAVARTSAVADGMLEAATEFIVGTALVPPEEMLAALPPPCGGDDPCDPSA